MQVTDPLYRVPRELEVTPTPLRRVMVIGSCLLSAYPGYIERAGAAADFMLVNNVPRLPDSLPHAASEYDFQIVQVPLRTVLNEHDYFRLSYGDAKGYDDLFARCIERLEMFLDGALKWNASFGIPSFVWNFLVPQQNPMGRLHSRYDLRNMVHFVEKLNEALAGMLESRRNCYFFDFDALVATIGRRYYQDDAVLHINHGAQLTDNDFERDQDRLEGAFKASESFPSKGAVVIDAAWNELLATYRTIRQADQVKLVIVDLDDTLWRGVVAEMAEPPSRSPVEGWPLGFAEALHYLKRRGILLAVVSKNDESRVRDLWPKIYTGRLAPTDFAALKINWQPKAENVAEILSEMNLLPQNVLFVDDNPVERAGVQAAFPAIRTLGGNPLLWRRSLLWSAETQVATVTAESVNRTEMMKAQISREGERKHRSRDEFLASLELKLEFFEVHGIEDAAFPRALELINKTNQFNTTGRRCTEQDCGDAFARGDKIFAFRVQDRFTTYGIVGAMLAQGSRIAQFVMSCRVAGMDVELAAVSEAVRTLSAAGFSDIIADTYETPLNLLSRDVYKRCGFEFADGAWRMGASTPVQVPSHIRITATGAETSPEPVTR